MAFRWLARRLLNSFRSPMIWSNGRRGSSRARRRRSSVSTWARKRLSAAAVAPGSVTVASRCSVTTSDIAIRPSPRSVLRLLPQALQLLFQGDHLQLAPDHHLLELLQVQDLFLQLGLGLLEVAHHLLVGAHVAQDADGADDLAVGVAQGGGVEGGGDDRAAGAARVEPGVAGDAALDHLAEGGGELPGLLGADEARERLLEELVGAEAEERGHRVVGLQDLALEIGDEYGVRGILDQALGVGPGLVELAHVAQDADGADGLAVGIAQGRGVQARGDDLAARTARVQDNVPHDTPLDHFAQCRRELPRFL